MNFREYIEETKENAKEYIKENWEYLKDKTGEEVQDDLFLADGVTGNGSGSFTFNTYKAQQNIAELMFDEDFTNALKWNFGQDLGELIKRGAEVVDVTARCLALYEFDINEIIEEIKEEQDDEILELKIDDNNELLENLFEELDNIFSEEIEK